MSQITLRGGLIAACVAAPLLLAACANGGLLGARTPVLDRGEQPCKDTSFPIYFDKGSDQLSADAHALIQTIGGRVKTCKVRSAEVVGLADAGGATDRGNADLARRRADSVARALAEAGLPIPAKEVTSAGASGAVTPGGKAEPLRRRTEVILHVAPVSPRA